MLLHDESNNLISMWRDVLANKKKSLATLMENTKDLPAKQQAIGIWLKQHGPLYHWLLKQEKSEKSKVTSLVLQNDHFVQLFDTQPDYGDTSADMMTLLTRNETRKISEVSATELENLAGMVARIKRDRLNELARRLSQLGDKIDLGAAPMPNDFFDLMALLDYYICEPSTRYNRVFLHLEDDALIRLLELPQHKTLYQRFSECRPLLPEYVFKIFICSLLIQYSLDELDQMCGDEEAPLLLDMPYLMLLSDLSTVDQLQAARQLPHIQAFMGILKENNMRNFRLEYQPGNPANPEEPAGKCHVHLLDHSWQAKTVKRLHDQQDPSGQNLLTALFKLISNERSIVKPLVHALDADSDLKVAILRTMVFDYPEYLEKFMHDTLNDSFLHDNFVTLARYNDPQKARRALKRPDVAILYLRETKDAQITFNQLDQAGIIDLLLSCEPNNKNLQWLGLEEGEDWDDLSCFFGSPEIMLFAHQKQLADGTSLLESLVHTDPNRLELIIHFMNKAASHYAKNAETKEQFIDQIKTLCDDMIDAGLMWTLLNMPAPHFIAEAELSPDVIARRIAKLFEDPRLQKYENKLRIIASKTLLSNLEGAINLVFSKTLTNMEELLVPNSAETGPSQEYIGHVVRSIQEALPQLFADTFVDSLEELRHQLTPRDALHKASDADILAACLKNPERIEEIYRTRITTTLQERYPRYQGGPQ